MISASPTITILVLKLLCSRLIRSIPWLPMPWLITSPGHQQPWYWTMQDIYSSWWRHQTETFSAQLAIYAGNSPVPGEFPTQKPVTRSFDVFFDLRLNNGWVNNREAGDLRRYRAHYDITVMWNFRPPVSYHVKQKKAAVKKSALRTNQLEQEQQIQKQTKTKTYIKLPKHVSPFALLREHSHLNQNYSDRNHLRTRKSNICFPVTTWESLRKFSLECGEFCRMQSKEATSHGTHLIGNVDNVIS